MKNTFFKRVSVVLIFTMLISSFAGVTANTTAQAAVEATSNIIYGGEGSVTKTLANGKTASVSVEGSIPTITVDGEKYGFYNKICTASVVISDDDLLHIFWHTGEYYVYDLYENARFIKAYKDASQKYCSEETLGATVVKGSSAANTSFNSCLIDNKYFYQYGKAGKKALMTRKEFEDIVDPQLPTPTPNVPTPTPNVPTPTPTPVPTRTPDIDFDIHTEFDITFWWTQYTSGKITWEQFTQIVWENKWEVKNQVTEKEETYYFYDESGKLVKTERILISNGTESGTGSGSAKEENKGKAEYEEKNSGNGGIHGTVDTKGKVYINNPAVIGVSKAKTITKKVYPARVRTTASGKTIKLYAKGSSSKKWISSISFNKKKGKMNFNGYKQNKIKACGFIKGTTNVFFLKKNGKLYSLPRIAKGKLKKKRKKKLIAKNVISVQQDQYGFGVKATRKTGSVKSIRNK